MTIVHGSFLTLEQRFALCSSHGGTYDRDLNVCACTNDRIIRLDELSETNNCTRLVTEDVANALLEINRPPINYRCPNVTSYDQVKYNDKLKCPYWMYRRVADYRKGSWIYEKKLFTPNLTCDTADREKVIKTSGGMEFEHADVDKLSHFYSQDPYFSSGERPNFWKGCESHNEVKFGPVERMALRTEYSYIMTRMREGMKGSLEKMASINALLGRKVMDSNSCETDFHSGINEKCNLLSQCQNEEGSLDQLTDETLMVLTQPMNVQVNGRIMSLNVDQLEDEITRVKNQIEQKEPGFFRSLISSEATENKLRRERGVPELLEKLKALQKPLNLTYSMYPWLKGKKFQNLRRGSKEHRDVKQAISEQLKDTYSHHKKRYDEFNEVSKLVNTTTRPVNMTEEKMNKIIANAPKIEISQGAGNDTVEDSQVRIQANSLMGTVQCLRKIKKLRNDVDVATERFALDVGITLATAGVGSAVNLAAKGTKVAKAAKMAKWVTGLTALGVDAWDAKESIEDAVSACSDSIPPSQKTNGDLACPAAATMKNQYDGKVGPSASSSMRQCLWASAMVAMNALPYSLPVVSRMAPGNSRKITSSRFWGRYSDEASKLDSTDKSIITNLINNKKINPDSINITNVDNLTDAERMAVASFLSIQRTGKPLTQAQKEALLAAHNYSLKGEAIGSYSQATITRKNKIMSDAGIPAELRRDLMERGLAGNRFIQIARDQVDLNDIETSIVNLRRIEDSIRNNALKSEVQLSRVQISGGHRARARAINDDVKDQLQRITTLRERLEAQRPKPRFSAGQVDEAVDEIGSLKEMARDKFGDSTRNFTKKAELEFVNALDPSSTKIIKGSKFNQDILCGKTTKGMKSWRRSSQRNVSNSSAYYKGFGNVNNVDRAALNRHYKSGKENYIGFGTLMDKNNGFAGGGGSFNIPLCILPGALVCVIGGAESEVILMDKNWSQCGSAESYVPRSKRR